MTLGLSDAFLITGVVAVLSLLAGAALRPRIDLLLDHLAKTLRVLILDNRRVTFLLPEGVEIDWKGDRMSKIFQQEFRIQNATRALVNDVAIRIRYRAGPMPEGVDRIIFGALMVPTAVAQGHVEAGDEIGENILRVTYIEPDSAFDVRTFANVDGELEVESACEKILSIRHRGRHVSESAERVLPRWLLALRPIFLPLTVILILMRRLGMTR